MCLRSWRAYMPGYEVVLVTRHNLHAYTALVPWELPWCDSPARESDIVRCELLATYGGVWSDASMLLQGPLPAAVADALATRPFVGFYLGGFTVDARFPVIENWWFACIAGHPFVTHWRRAFMDFRRNATVATRLERFLKRGVNYSGFTGMANYLFMHVCAQYVMQRLMTAADIDADLRPSLFLADEGPLAYLTQHAWNPTAGVAALVAAAGSSPAKYPMTKFRSCDRPALEANQHWGRLAPPST
jgi:hypothetical protein